MNTELLEALTILEQEKNISKDTMMDAIDQCLKKSFRHSRQHQSDYGQGNL